MAIIFGGGELSSFHKFNAIETTTSGTFRLPARCGIHVKKGGWITTNTIGLLDDVWFHFDMGIGLVSPTSTPIKVLSSTNTVLFTVRGDGSVIVGNTTIGIVPIFTPGLFTLDIHLRGGSNGLVEIYADTQVVFSATGNFTFTNMSTLTLAPVGTDATDNTGTVWSQAIIANENTLGYKLATLELETAGSQAEWAGQIGDVSEIALNDATYITASTAGLVDTFETVDLESEYTNIRAVVISALAKYSSTGPKNLDAVFRIGGQNYTSAMTPLSGGFSPSQAIFHVNPQTYSALSNSDINDAEYGIRSKV